MPLSGGIKIILIILLLAANFYLIAWDSLNKFLQRGIMLEVSTEHSDGLMSPAITFCASGSLLWVLVFFFGKLGFTNHVGVKSSKYILQISFRSNSDLVDTLVWSRIDVLTIQNISTVILFIGYQAPNNFQLIQHMLAQFNTISWASFKIFQFQHIALLNCCVLKLVSQIYQ